MRGLKVVEEMCLMIRAVFERVLTASDIEGTSGTCLHASIVLQQTLERFAGGHAAVRGGDGAADGGACDVRGCWYAHYWVEGACEDGTAFVADITADQFGWPSVVVLPLDDARARYRPGSDEICKEAVDDELARMELVA